MIIWVAYDMFVPNITLVKIPTTFGALPASAPDYVEMRICAKNGGSSVGVPDVCCDTDWQPSPGSVADDVECYHAEKRTILGGC